jgi:hypothetical protein
MYGEWITIGSIQVFINCTPNTPDNEKSTQAWDHARQWAYEHFPKWDTIKWINTSE